jgi:uncharacterized protein YggE
MKRYFIVLVALFFAMSLSLGTAQAQFVEKTPYVLVNGHSEIKVSPDEIFLSITLDESDTKGKVSLEEQRKNMFQALKRLNIDVEKQLTVIDMSSNYFRRKSSLAVTQYELKVGSATEAREVFEALDAVKISNVDVVRAQCSKIEEYRTEARKAAIRDAKAKAAELAEAIGQSIGSCIEINDYTTTTRPVFYANKTVMRAANMDSAIAEEAYVEPVVEFKQITITYNVSARFELHWK